MISIALATYNGKKYIEKQLLSIVNQSVVPDEIVITDDCSTDDTIDFINDFKDKYNSIKWKVVVNNTQLGFAKNFIKSISLTEGDFIFLSDQDDIWERNKIHEMIKKIKSNDKIDILFSSYRCIDGNDNIIDFQYKINNSIYLTILTKIFDVNKYTYKSFIKSMNIAGMSMCIKKRVIKNFLKLDINTIKYHDLFLSLFASIKDGLYFYNKVLTNYRLHNDNVIGLKSAVGIKEDRISWLTYNINNQVLIKDFLLNNRIDNKYIKQLIEIIEFNNNRISIMENKRLLNAILNIIKICLFPSLLSYFGDIAYIMKG